ncbi:MAG: hypothetical protein NC548_61580 [Lachnospiraceae bacterium]|nr:hypothetical protein [Lachnospiraceae bacterium]
MKEPIFQFNDRVEYKDSESNFHIGFVKQIKRQRKGWFSHEWVYNICEYVKGVALRKVYEIPESDIFGKVEKPLKDKPLNVKEHKTYKGFDEMKELINSNK